MPHLKTASPASIGTKVPSDRTTIEDEPGASASAEDTALAKPLPTTTTTDPLVCHPTGSTGRTETVKGGPLGIRVISKNKIIYVNHVEENSKLKHKVAVGDRITHINGNIIWGIKPSVFAQLLAESTKKSNGEDQVCRLTLQSPSQVKAQVQKMQQMQMQKNDEIARFQNNSPPSVSTTDASSSTASRSHPTAPPPNVNFNRNMNVPHAAIDSGLTNNTRTNTSKRGGRNLAAIAPAPPATAKGINASKRGGRNLAAIAPAPPSQSKQSQTTGFLGRRNLAAIAPAPLTTAKNIQTTGFLGGRNLAVIAPAPLTTANTGFLGGRNLAVIAPAPPTTGFLGRRDLAAIAPAPLSTANDIQATGFIGRMDLAAMAHAPPTPALAKDNHTTSPTIVEPPQNIYTRFPGRRDLAAIAPVPPTSALANDIHTAGFFEGRNPAAIPPAPSTPSLVKDTRTSLHEKILFAGLPHRKFRFILVALATACQEKLFQNKWMHSSKWVKIINQNYDFASIFQFTEQEMLDAIKSNQILKQEMERSENICGMFLTTYTFKNVVDVAGYYISCTALPSASSSDLGSTLYSHKRSVTAKAPRRTVRQCLDDPSIDVSKMRFATKKYLPRDLVHRALAIQEPKKTPPRLGVPRQRMIDPLCDALRNGPPLPKGTSVYWDSLEARKYFGASKDETSLDAINRRIDILRKALSTHDGYQDITEIEGDLEITAEQVYELRIQIQAVIAVFVVMLEKMPELGIVKCCEEAEKKLSEYYDQQWSVMKFKKWFNDFRLTGKFLVKQKKEKKGRKRKRTSNTDGNTNADED